MRILLRMAACALVVVIAGCAREPESVTPETIVSLERAALDRCLGFAHRSAGLQACRRAGQASRAALLPQRMQSNSRGD